MKIKRDRQSTLLSLASNGSDGFQKVKKGPVISFSAESDVWCSCGLVNLVIVQLLFVAVSQPPLYQQDSQFRMLSVMRTGGT